MSAVDLVGWAASAILLATLATQIRKQWRERRTEGVSSWLFVGQFAASCGFLAYSALVGDTVFVVTNAMLAVTALVGQGIYLVNRRAAADKRDAKSAKGEKKDRKEDRWSEARP